MLMQVQPVDNLPFLPRGESRGRCQPHPAPENRLPKVVGVARKAVQAAGKKDRETGES